MQVSLTYQGVLVMLVGYVLRVAGLEMPDVEVANFVSALIVVIGTIMTLYGRWRAGGVSKLGIKQ